MCTLQQICANRGKIQNGKAEKADRTCPYQLSRVTNTTREIKLTLQMERIMCTQLKNQFRLMQEDLNKPSVHINHELSRDFISIMGKTKHEITPFMNLFRQQQQKLFASNSTGVRYHPMIIRYCLSFLAKSPSLYEEL